MNIQNYVRAQSLEQAYELNQNKRNAVLGGMMWMRLSERQIQTAIDLCDLGLDKIEETGELFSFGAMVSLRQLELHEGFCNYTHGASVEALKGIVGVQFRNTATLGGSVFGRFGFSDVTTLFLALDSYVELHHGGVVPLATFMEMEPDRDVLTRIIVKKEPVSVNYQSVRIARTDFPVLTCCLAQARGVYRTVIGARPGKAMLVVQDSTAIGEMSHIDSIENYADEIVRRVPVQTNARGSAAYRTALIKNLVKRGLTTLEGENVHGD